MTHEKQLFENGLPFIPWMVLPVDLLLLEDSSPIGLWVCSLLFVAILVSFRTYFVAN